MTSPDGDENDATQGSNASPPEPRSRSRDEIALVVGCLLGEQDAFHELVSRYAALVHAVATTVLAHTAKDVSLDADDLAERFFVDVWQAPQAILGNFDPLRGGLSTYLKNVATHRCQKALRSRRVLWPVRRPRHDAAMLEQIPARSSTEFDPNRFIARLLEKLSATSRGLIEARFGLREESVAEMAKRLGMSKTKAYRRIATVLRQRLRPLAERMDAELD